MFCKSPISISELLTATPSTHFLRKVEREKKLVLRLLNKSICSRSVFICLIRAASAAQEWLPLHFSHYCCGISKCALRGFSSQNCLSPLSSFHQRLRALGNTVHKKNYYRCWRQIVPFLFKCDCFMLSHLMLHH